ncbi:hypothetical protein [Myxococcus landrumensis]|uniref:Lipoprotein n=1 Tax=Myxococcus landrumensis TaxID=2813577 RepID=A0ABX7N3H9_9BACT|nr:hypothetical protein [Myxococcus landrumus]QSQ12999.1 hypothetical protein JY572_32335 [Myxococcus landrumus]
MTKTFVRLLIFAAFVLASWAEAQPRFTPTPLPEVAVKPRIQVLFSTTPMHLYLGWPLVVTVQVRLHPDADADLKQLGEPGLVVAPRQGDWGSLFRFELSRSSRISRRRDVTPLELRPFGNTPRQIVLSPGAAPVLIGHFVLTETQTAALVPAYYLLYVHFDSRTGGGEEGWKGTAHASMELQIDKEPAVQDANLECEKVLATREYLRVTGAEKKALDVLDAFLSRTPASVAMPCWAVRAELHVQEGNAKAAMDAYCNASRAESVLLDAAVRENAKKANIASISPPQYDAHCERLKRQLKETAPAAGQPQGSAINPESEPQGR